MATKNLDMILRARDDASKKFALVGKSVDKLSGSLNTLIGIGMAYLGIRAIKEYVVGQLAAIDATAKSADELGVTTEALIGFSHAAELSGATTEVVAKSLQRMTRRLGEAAAGYGEGVKGLELLGLSAAELAKKKPDEAFIDVADAISKIPDASMRAAAAYALLGRQGQELMNFMMMGRSGLEAARLETEALGMAFSRLDASAVEEANDAMTRLKGSIKGVWTSLTIEMAPAITSAADTLVFFAKNAKDVWQIAGDQGVLWAVGVYEDAKHLVVDELPGLLKWFAGATMEYLATLGDNVTQFFRNLWANIAATYKNFITELSFDLAGLWIKATEKGETRRLALESLEENRRAAIKAASVPMGQGMQGMAELKAFSDLLSERATTDLEKALQAQIDATLKAIADRAAKEAGAPAPGKAGVWEPPAEKDKKKKTKTGSPGVLAAVESRFLTSAGRRDPMERVADDTAKVAKATEKGAEATVELLKIAFRRERAPHMHIEWAGAT